MTTAEKLKDARQKANLSQKALGERAKMSQQMIAQYESGTRKPKIETLRRISIALDVPLYTLVDWSQYSPDELREDLELSNLTNDFLKFMSRSLSQMDCISDRELTDLTSKIMAGERPHQHVNNLIRSDMRCIFLLYNYEKLNDKGRDEAVKRITELTEITKYTEPKKE